MNALSLPFVEPPTVTHGDCLDVLRGMADESVDAVVTDPPYELGFMGRKWDATGIAHSVDLWREVLRVLKPGGHLLAFGGTRTYHRMTCAIEDAGAEIRDCITWHYGNGFPKSLNIGDGRGTALKPATEPIVVARKPLVGTVAANVARHGTGAINVEATRVGSAKRVPGSPKRVDASAHAVSLPGYDGGSGHDPNVGRWPPNLLLTHSADCGDACAEDCPVAMMDAQSLAGGMHSAGSATDGAHCAGTKPSGGTIYHRRAPHNAMRFGDSGGASRFFPTFRHDADPFLYQAKAAKRERGEGNTHPTVKPVALMRWLVRLVTPTGGVVLDPFAGSGTTLVAAKAEGMRAIGIEREAEYVAIIKARVAA